MEPVYPSTKRFLTFADSLVPKAFWRDERSFRKARILLVYYMVTAVFLALYAVFYWVIGFRMGFWACLSSAAAVPLILLLFTRTQRFSIANVLFDSSMILMFFLLIYGTGGIHSTILPWLGMVPASGFVFDGWFRGAIMSGVSLVAVLVLAFLEYQGIQLPILYDTGYELSLMIVAQGGLIVYIFLILTAYDTSRARTIMMLDQLNADLEARQMEVEHQREALAESYDRVANVNHNLETLVTSRTEMLAEAKRELNTFLYEAAHALRRPMVRIMGLTSILEDETDPKAIKILHDHIVTTSALMDQILHNLIAVSALQERDLVYERHDLVAWLTSKIAMNPVLSNHERVDVELDLAPNLEVTTDLTLLEICLDGILENAVRYTEKTGRKPLVRLSAKREGDEVVLTVTDNGMGMPSGAASRAKEMFFRATEKVSGGGLGLYVSEKAMARMGGTLTLASVLDKGTTVCLRFPG
jgi:signal transduction histidine kinase